MSNIRYDPLTEIERKNIEVNRTVPLGLELKLILIIDRLVLEINSLREQLESATSRFDAETRNGSSIRGPGQIA